MATATKTKSKHKTCPEPIPAAPQATPSIDRDALTLERAIRLREQREACGPSPAEMSTAMGMTLASYQAVEDGERPVGMMWISVFAFALNVKPELIDPWFVGKSYRLRPTRRP
ncbi:helix-turn-helix transcriptional regulator (plasmid) [Isosphaeraceae bacterium EP7]